MNAPASPWVVRLPLALVQRCRSISAVVRAELGVRTYVHAFEFKNDERPFALALLRRKTNVWVYRANQRRFCGDFVVVDMSARPARRVWVIDLKMGRAVKTGGGGAGVQLVNAEAAARSLDVIAGATGNGDPR